MEQNTKSNTMKAIVIKGYGTYERLEYATVKRPKVNYNEVLIKVYASSATTADVMMLSGKPFFTRLFLGLKKPKHTIPGTGFAGVVVAAGKDVSEFSIGDEVFGETTLQFSANAEYIVVPCEGVILHKPENMSFADASTFCDGPLTSIFFLKEIGNIQPGQKVLINGASGSLGTAAIQLANYFGAEVTGVCSSGNIGLVKSLGADYVIDYTIEDFTKSDERYDIIFDSIGKSSYLKSKKVLTNNGLYLTPVLTYSTILQMVVTSLRKGKKAKFAASGLNSNVELRLFLLRLVEIFELGKLKTVIDRQFPLEKVAMAYQYISLGHKKGNVVIINET